jgi:hypothetical protein
MIATDDKPQRRRESVIHETNTSVLKPPATKSPPRDLAAGSAPNRRPQYSAGPLVSLFFFVIRKAGFVTKAFCRLLMTGTEPNLLLARLFLTSFFKIRRYSHPAEFIKDILTHGPIFQSLKITVKALPYM